MPVLLTIWKDAPPAAAHVPQILAKINTSITQIYWDVPTNPKAAAQTHHLGLNPSHRGINSRISPPIAP
uniref:Uncharacterized protein n=1 Tax=Arundo donax TaxID=35708 RepID=A0A0A9BW18_ARUDO